jgi:hypothetical protein
MFTYLLDQRRRLVERNLTHSLTEFIICAFTSCPLVLSPGRKNNAFDEHYEQLGRHSQLILSPALNAKTLTVIYILFFSLGTLPVVLRHFHQMSSKVPALCRFLGLQVAVTKILTPLPSCFFSRCLQPHGMNCLHILLTAGHASCHLGHLSGISAAVSSPLLVLIDAHISTGSVPTVAVTSESGSVVTFRRAQSSRKHPNAEKRARLRKREALKLRESTPECREESAPS